MWVWVFKQVQVLVCRVESAWTPAPLHVNQRGEFLQHHVALIAKEQRANLRVIDVAETELLFTHQSRAGVAVTVTGNHHKERGGPTVCVGFGCGCNVEGLVPRIGRTFGQLDVNNML